MGAKCRDEANRAGSWSEDRAWFSESSENLRLQERLNAVAGRDDGQGGEMEEEDTNLKRWKEEKD